MKSNQSLSNMKNLTISCIVFSMLMLASIMLNSPVVFAGDDDSDDRGHWQEYSVNKLDSDDSDDDSDLDDYADDDSGYDDEVTDNAIQIALESLIKGQTGSVFLTLMASGTLDGDIEQTLSVYFNGHFIGTLDDIENQLKRFSFEIDLDFINNDRNIIKVKAVNKNTFIQQVIWRKLVDQDQFQINGDHLADLKSILINNSRVENQTVIVSSQQDVHFITGGNYLVEYLLVDPSGTVTSRITDSIAATSGQKNIFTFETSYPNDSLTGNYLIKSSLFSVDVNDVLSLVDIETLTFSHEAPVGPSDLDNDSLDNQTEIQLGTNPNNIDTDSDGIADNIEVGPDIQSPIDTDNDGLIDAIESVLNDSDNDGLTDQNDSANNDPCLPNTNIVACANKADADNDGLSDSQEAAIGTNPADADSENDGLSDLLEVGSDINNPVDSDNDGIIDAIESSIIDDDNDGTTNQFDSSNNDPCIPSIISALCNNNISLIDSDNDGIYDNTETTLGTNPFEADTDGDGIDDLAEIGNDVNSPNDNDADGLNDAIESNTIDTDSDGIFDNQDKDSDGDGIPDANESGGPSITADTDNDGLPNQQDLDSDNDGITDLVEAGGTDTNHDGLLDDQADMDNDGLANRVDSDNGGDPLTIPDTDNDSLPDFIDPDSDDDSVNDLIEAGGTDLDSNGQLDNAQDSNGNGLADLVDPSNTGTPLLTIDTDADNLPDNLDSDSDADGSPDSTDPERTNPCVPSATAAACIGSGDSDGDGLDNSQENQVGTNPDLSDSDEDGISDDVEIGDNPNKPLDADGDGIIDANESNILDSDNDGTVNSNDVDSDGDGIPDIIEVGDNENTLFDTDGDGQPDSLDADSDNDGLPDFLEGGLSGNDSDNDSIDDAFDVDNTGGVDANNDGIDDQAIAIDTDKDGLPDFRDNDSDNDGISDTAEANLSGNDTDSDGIDDVIDVDQTGGEDANGDGVDVSYAIPDTDADNLADFRDLDSDNDGSNDVIEAGLIDSNNDALVDSGQTLINNPVDTDNDGTADFRDVDSNENGSNDIDENQLASLDIDKDGRIDNTLDVDKDGIPDVSDDNASRFGEGISASSQAPSASDVDGDGILNTVDLDDDNDGIPDLVEGSIDTDGDSIIDSLDIDSDNDGIKDIIEFGGVDTDNDGMTDNFTDVNANGIDDTYDSSLPANAPLMLPDTDGDGTPNYRDLDSDADGFSDELEGLNDYDQDGIPDYIDKNEKIRTSTHGIGANGWELFALGFLLLIGRKVINLRKSFISVLLILLTSNAYADVASEAEIVDEPVKQWTTERWFIGADLGLSWIDPDDSNTDFNVTDDTSQGLKIEVGYDLNKYIATEGFYLFPGSAEIAHVNRAIGKLGKLKYHTFGLGVDYRPIWHNKKVLPHLKAGLSTSRNSVTDDRIDYERVSAVSLYYGAGVSWRFRHDMAAHAEIVTYDRDEMFLSVGVRKYFGGKAKNVEKIAPMDSDNDGVSDTRDQCENTYPGAVVNSVGCEMDDDKDSIINRLDLCPNSKPGVKVDNDGCEINEITILRGINFETNSAKIKPDSKHILDGVADILLRYTTLKVEIAGHSDNRGDLEFNLHLSQSRAESVREYLIAKGAIAENLTARGYGETEPLVYEDSDDAWMENRRVELVILENLASN